jgi:hypothetical protein
MNTQILELAAVADGGFCNRSQCHHTVSRDNSHQSTSHLHLEVGTALKTDGGWVCRARARLNKYGSGVVGGLNLSAALRF